MWEQVSHILTHTHPPADGTIERWEDLRVYTRCVGIPLSIGAQLVVKGNRCSVSQVGFRSTGNL
ncbi:hypothetical protein CMK22_12485 [Candidatus Poribacteria bacterium]|nr:hypothetical protein [Candidatus Poribacteria bacterium]